MDSAVAFVKNCVGKEEEHFVDYLVECGQENVLKGLTTEESVKEFVKEVKNFDAFYPGGLKSYVEKCRDLLGKSSRGENPFEGWTPSVDSVPPVTHFEFNTKEFYEMEKIGLEELTYCGFVLIAGGLGERLGYNSIKVGLPIETFTYLSYLNFYIKKILAIQHRASRPNCILPFAIMTSENNHDITVNYLKENHYFGMSEDQVYIMMQDCIPAVRNLAGEIAVDAQGHIIKKPHGHGDVHFCLYRDGVIATWLQRYDLHRVFFFQDTNTVNFYTMPCVAALSLQQDAHMISTCVKRRPHEQTGGLCLLRHANGDAMVCNVEYNQLEDVLSHTIDPRGDFADASGFSPFPGNCNNLCMNLREYLKVISRSHGIVPEFVNPKYKPGSKTEYLQPTRLESLMQDYPKLLLQTSKEIPVNRTCLVVTFPRFMAWSPVKNDYERAAQLKAKTGFEESPRSGEADILALFRRQLLTLNECVACNPQGEKRIDIEDGAYVCLWPEAGVCTEELHGHIGRNVVIKKGSVLVIKTPHWFIDNFTLDGCCVIEDDASVNGQKTDAAVELVNVTVQNKGWHYVDIDKDDMSIGIVVRMRGYDVRREEQCVIRVNAPGKHRLENMVIRSSADISFEN